MKSTANFVITITAIVTVLIIGKGILIPFVFALIFWFLTREIRKTIYKIPYAKRFLPDWLSNIIVFALIILSISFISQIISDSITEVTVSYTKYEPNISHMIEKLGVYFNTDIVDSVRKLFIDFNYGAMLGRLANGISGLLGDTFMILIYALFLFLEENSLIKKIRKLFSSEEAYDRYIKISDEIENSISNYLKLKTYVSLLTGILSFIALYIVGVDSAPFWAFMIFLLNYIPTIGSLVATLFPAIFCLLQFGEFTPFFVVLISVGTIQMFVGNFVEPKLFGKSLNLSPLVTIIGLAIWGNIWGITGMILSVPITVIMIIIFAKFDNTRSIAILLSENGEIDNFDNTKTI